MMPTIERDAFALEVHAIRTTGSQWLEALATRDPKRVSAFYANDGAFLVPNAPIAQGREQVTEMWTHLLSAPNLSLRWAPSTVEVAKAGDLAFEIGTYQLEMDRPA